MEELDPQSRKDVLDELKRKFDKLNSGATTVRTPKVVYKVEEPTILIFIGIYRASNIKWKIFEQIKYA